VRRRRLLKCMLKSQMRLEIVFHFNHRDLHCNRGGLISNRQKLRLRCLQVLLPLHILMGIIITTSLAIITNILIHAIAAFQAYDWPYLIRLVIGIIGVILMIVLAVSGLTERLKRLNHDIQNGQVEIKTGVISFRPYIRNKFPVVYIMQIGKEEYKIMCWQRWAFHQHSKYAVYAAPQIKLVLSAERISDDSQLLNCPFEVYCP